jgi:hypothetical protein
MASRRIDDHSFWAGSRSKESVLPMQAKMKQESSAEGAGHLGDYPDTTEAIKKDQGMQDKKMRSQSMKPGFRY